MVQVENEELLYLLDAIEQMGFGPALTEPDLFITSPSIWSALRRFKDDLHRYILSPIRPARKPISMMVVLGDRP